ncbi:SusE domain-containing protein [Flavobacterium granuli]|uniref:SusE outer membrane protein n=1 Tax=Flavobacterium granuli TaxID=280093 RepID=A0A1M5PIZ2_9FLAO|nr:SusE domain-containing protein [Flavobacterium granuli]PRZ26504.1 SusE-like outer membrane protein [Flavobacterium granuli]SHH01734.1 SusE outer membrane protein [Flavobacterium granuli]
MKNIYITLIAFMGLLAVSCNADDVDNRPIVEALSSPELTAPATGKQFILNEDNASKEASKFEWSAAKYSAKVVVSYTLLIDKKGGNFSEAKVLGETSNLNQLSILVKDLNFNVKQLGGVAGTEGFYDLKVMSSVSGAVVLFSENVITIAVTPYNNRVANNCANQYVVGAGVPTAGWGWGSPLTLICNDNVLVSTADLVNDSFRFFTTNGDWGSGRNYPWYIAAGYKISSSLVNANDGDSNFRFTGTPGKYRIKVDQVAKTLTVAQGETAAKSIWLVGAATPGGWSWVDNKETELPLISDGIFEVPLVLKSGEAFRVFFGNDGTENGNWGTGKNYLYYAGEGYTIPSELENAMDGDSNFKYTGVTALRVFKINTITKTITLN